jgi:hypothetical protein
MNIPQQLDELTKKVDDLQKQLNQQNEYIIDQSLIIQKLIEKLVVIPSNPRFLDERFTGPMPQDKWKPYKGPDCTTGNNIEYIRNDNSVCETRTMTPIYTKSYDGTKTILPINTIPDCE